MTRRDPPKLATGSMADIAFLLLVFWLMTTTLETDIGILQLLPASEESPPEPIDPINILEVYANLNNELMVENEIIEIQRSEKHRQLLSYEYRSAFKKNRN